MIYIRCKLAEKETSLSFSVSSCWHYEILTMGTKLKYSHAFLGNGLLLTLCSISSLFVIDREDRVTKTDTPVQNIQSREKTWRISNFNQIPQNNLRLIINGNFVIRFIDVEYYKTLNTTTLVKKTQVWLN